MSSENFSNLTEFLQPDEDARSLISRLLSYDLKSGVDVLDAVSAFRKGAAIEIVSAPQAGKSVLCMEAAVRFILPDAWEGAHIGGLQGHVFYLDADLKFDLIQFLALAQSHLRKVLPAAQHGWAQPTSTLIGAALPRLTLVSAEKSTDFLDALEHVTEVMQARVSEEGMPALLILDSATAFFDTDRAGGLDPLLYPSTVHRAPPLSLVDAHARMVAAVNHACAQHAVVMLTTTAAVHFEEAGLECQECLPPAWEEVVTSRLALYRQPCEAYTTESKRIARWLKPHQQAHFVLREDGTCEAFT